MTCEKCPHCSRALGRREHLVAGERCDICHAKFYTADKFNFAVLPAGQVEDGPVILIDLRWDQGDVEPECVGGMARHLLPEDWDECTEQHYIVPNDDIETATQLLRDKSFIEAPIPPLWLE